MMVKVSKDLLSYPTVRRGDWLLKVSVYKNNQVLVIASHVTDINRFVLKFFNDKTVAADFIDELVNKEETQ